jgi:glycosyltransferase involved in cell wall biosynthesis
MATDESIELGLSFFHDSDSEKKVINKTTYYPILKQSGMKNPYKTLYTNWFSKSDDNNHLDQILQVIDDFKPDVIHVFGTEGFFGLVQDQTRIPVVIHLQGLINPYLNSYLPPGFSKNDFWFNSSYFLDHVIGRSIPFRIKQINYQANREALILRNAKHVMGRTEWDKSMATFYNSCVNYYHVDEVLRPIFYEETRVNKSESGKLVILSTLSPTIYKGIDMVLKTANLLVKESVCTFEWHVVGLNEDDKLVKHFEKKLKMNAKSCQLNFLGRKNAEEVKTLLTQSDVFVHPSYIDNSPNSVCEAQMAGLLVIACHVGGVPSIIKDDETGKLIPANGVFELASLLKNYAKNKVNFDIMAENGKKAALQRHDRQKIKADVLQCYQVIQR